MKVLLGVAAASVAFSIGFAGSVLAYPLARWGKLIWENDIRGE